MPNFFIVVTNSETPTLYLSQRPYEETLRALRSWPYSHTKRSFVFVAQPIPDSGANPHGKPTGCIQLALHARVDQNDPSESYQYLWGSSIDDLPTEQALQKCQQAEDYINKMRVRVEGRAKQTEATEQSTGT
jgi:hypothetical protein